jgi:hypothetical protein
MAIVGKRKSTVKEVLKTQVGTEAGEQGPGTGIVKEAIWALGLYKRQRQN